MFNAPRSFAQLTSHLFGTPAHSDESNRLDYESDGHVHANAASTTYGTRTQLTAARPHMARRANPVEVAATLPILESLANHVQQTAVDLQDSVLEISSGFGGMAGRARESVQMAQSGLNSDDGSADQTIGQIRDVLTALLNAVQESSQSSSKLATRIQTLEQVLTRVDASLKRVEKISEEARIVGLNGRLEAARAGEHGTAFNVVANETKNLGIHASETSASIRKLVDELDASLRVVSRELQERVHRDAQTAERSQGIVTELLDRLCVMHRGMTESLQGTELLSQQLSEDICRSVMALQFQDRINQRLDHVVEALQALQENLQPFGERVSRDQSERRADDWRRWLESRSTMKSERDVLSHSASCSNTVHADTGSVELF